MLTRLLDFLNDCLRYMTLICQIKHSNIVLWLSWYKTGSREYFLRRKSFQKTLPHTLTLIAKKYIQESTEKSYDPFLYVEYD